MSGSLTELAAIGAQDAYLKVDPEITFFKSVYKRHSNYALEQIEVPFNNTAKYGQRIVCTIPRSGDLITDIWIRIELPKLLCYDSTALDYYTLGNQQDANNDNDLLRYVDEVGFALLTKVGLEIGGTTWDTHTGQYMSILHSQSENAVKNTDELIGKNRVAAQRIKWSKDNRVLMVPLQFWFNRYVSMALPIIALQFHDIKLNIEFSSKASVIEYGDASFVPDLGQVSLVVNYVYLDTTERSAFASTQHEYLIDQLQTWRANSTFTQAYTTSYPNITPMLVKELVTFNHPVHELMFVFSDNRWQPGNSGHYPVRPFDFSHKDDQYAEPQHTLIEGTLLLNNHERQVARGPDFWYLQQHAKAHSKIPDKHIYVWEWGYDAEDFKPSGSLNFSRIDNVHLLLKVYPFKEGCVCMILAKNRNVITIKAGMGGVKYAN